MHYKVSHQFYYIRSPINFTSSSFASDIAVIRAWFYNLPIMPLHFLWTQCKDPVQQMVLLPTPFLQTLHGYLPESFNVWRLTALTMILVSLMLTLRPLASKLVFHLINFILRSSSVLVMITRLSAYSNSQDVPEQNSRDKASSTMMNKRGLSTELWWTPTLTPNSSL